MKRLKNMFSSHRDRIIGVWIVATSLLASQFNACSQVVFNETMASKQKTLSLGEIHINGDAEFTNDKQVRLNLSSFRAKDMFITNDPTCKTGGIWEAFSTQREWSLGFKNRDVSVYVAYRDEEGVVGACVSDSILHDDINPSVFLQKSPLFFREAGASFSFRASDTGSGLKSSTCRWPGESAEACSLSSSRNPLDEGAYSISVEAEDHAGNKSDPAEQIIIVDRTPPTVTITSGPALVTGSPDISVTFSATDSLSGVRYTRCAIDSTIDFKPCQSPLTANLPDGNHYVLVQAEDFAGNVSENASINFRVDLTAPTIRITKAPLDLTNNPNAFFAYEGSDEGQPISQFLCSLDEGAYTPCAIEGITYSNLTEGRHTFGVKGLDSAGNPSKPTLKRWTIDLTPPTVTISTGPSPLSSNTSASFSFNASDTLSGIQQVKCLLDNTLVACGSNSATLLNVGAGDHSFQVIAIDGAGNEGRSTPYNFRLDLDAPTIELTQVPPAFSNLASDEFKFVTRDLSSSIAAVECRLDGGAYTNCRSFFSQTYQNLGEGSHTFSARARDAVGNFSKEAKYSWTVDRTGPVIAYYQLPPQTLLEGRSLTLGFTAVDSISGLQKLACELNERSEPCQSGVNISWAAVQGGHHDFQVTATDKAGNSTTDIKSWDALIHTPQMQDISVSSNNKVDILVIDDNSGSMEDEQKNMASRFSGFLDKLKGLDWQVGIITTDVSENAAQKDGRLVEYRYGDKPTSSFILTSFMDYTKATKMFGETIQMGTDGSGEERGFRAAIRALERSLDTTKSVNAPNRALIRSGAALSILIVSDSYDDKNQPEDLLNFVKNTWGTQKPFTFHSIVVPESNYTNPLASKVNSADPCANYRESVQYDGRAYHRLSEMTGGIKGTVCSENYSTQLAAMGKATYESVTATSLLCQPVDRNLDGLLDERDVELKLSNGAIFSDIKLQGQKITFGSPLPPGNHKLYYSCL